MKNIPGKKIMDYINYPKYPLIYHIQGGSYGETLPQRGLYINKEND